MRRFDLRDLLRRAGGDDRAAGIAAFRAEIDDVVGGLDDVEIVLDDEQRVAGFEQLLERRQQLRDVVEVQARRRLVEDVEQPLAAVRRKVRGDLDPLRLSARQRRRRLAEAQVAEADLVEHLEPAQHFRRPAEERQRLADGQVEHLVDRPAAVLTSSTCGLNRLPSHWSHGTNTSARNCISTRTSPSPWHASQRPPGTLNEKWLAVSPRARASFVGGEQLADRIERLEIGDRVRARRAADRRLIDEHDVGDELDALERRGTCRRACPSRPSRA